MSSVDNSVPYQSDPQPPHPSSNESPDEYRYKPLPGTKSIRLLELRGGQADDEIVCSLKLAELDDSSPYEAISYVWGDQPTRFDVRCDGQRLSITSSLFAALQNYRLPDTPRLLWADAVCINQNDLDERRCQVNIMRDIYAGACRVLVWLGHNERGNAEAAQEVIERIVKECCSRSNVTLSDLHLVDDPDELVEGDDWETIPAGASEEWLPVAWLFSRGWFRRVWVIQEVEACEHVVLRCGNVELSWDKIGLGSCWIHRQSIASDFNDFTIFNDSQVFNAYVMYIKDHRKQQGFLNLLDSCRDFLATDPRDKVYALLGFPPFSEGCRRIEPDYEKPMLQVCSNIVSAAIELTGTLSVLSYVQHGSVIDDGWPSWVPRWNVALDVASLGEDWAADDEINPPASIRLQGEVLPLPGVYFDTITTVSETMTIEDFNLSKNSTAKLHPFVSFWEKFIDLLPEGPLQGIPTAVYSSTLTAGLDLNYDWVGEDYDRHGADFWAYMVRLMGLGTPLWWSQHRAILSEAEVDSPEWNHEIEHKIALETAEKGDWKRFEIAASRVCDQRRLFLTSRGYVGIGPQALRPGDLVCILFGGRVPYILRPIDSYHQLVGQSFVGRIMLGEAMEWYRKGDLHEQVFELR